MTALRAVTIRSRPAGSRSRSAAVSARSSPSWPSPGRAHRRWPGRRRSSPDGRGASPSRSGTRPRRPGRDVISKANGTVSTQPGAHDVAGDHGAGGGPSGPRARRPAGRGARWARRSPRRSARPRAAIAGGVETREPSAMRWIRSPSRLTSWPVHSREKLRLRTRRRYGDSRTHAARPRPRLGIGGDRGCVAVGAAGHRRSPRRRGDDRDWPERQPERDGAPRGSSSTRWPRRCRSPAARRRC